MIGEGPMDKWECDLEKMSRDALVLMVRSQRRMLIFLGIKMDTEEMAESIRLCKKYGRLVSLTRRTRAWIDNPDREMVKAIRRQKSAKAAARRRKKEARIQKMREVKH